MMRTFATLFINNLHTDLYCVNIQVQIESLLITTRESHAKAKRY